MTLPVISTVIIIVVAATICYGIVKNSRLDSGEVIVKKANIDLLLQNMSDLREERDKFRKELLESNMRLSKYEPEFAFRRIDEMINPPLLLSQEDIDKAKIPLQERGEEE